MKFGLEVQVIENIISVLEQHPKVDKAFVFGSRAKGNYRPDSDIDIAIKGNEITTDDIIAISVAIETKGITHKFDLIDYNSIKEPALKEHIDRVGIEFYSRWKEYKMSQISSFLQGLQVPIKEQSEIYEEGYIRFIRIIDVTQDDPKNIRYVKKTHDKNILKKGDLAMLRYGNPGIVTDKYEGIIANNLFKILPLFDNLYINKFLYFYLRQPSVLDYFDSTQNSSTIPAITFSQISDLAIKLPPLPEQHAIALVLSSLDDKIDLLYHQNATLEKISETLFRQWFVVEAKDEWEEGKLEDLVTVKYGKDHKKLSDGLIPVFGSGGLMRSVNVHLYDKESVLIPRKGTLNNVMYVDDPFWTVDTMFYTQMKQSNIALFVFHFVKNLDLVSMNVGSAVPSMTTEVLNNHPVDIPPSDILEKFEEAARPLYNKIKSNTIQIRTLSQTRDTLLPKLMSGEVRVEM